MTEDDRSGLLDNAIKFLQDPQVRNSNLSKQLSFLESKGLSKEEIDEAMRRAGVVKSAVTPTEYSPPPLPVGPPPNSKRIVESGFNWGKFLVILAVIGSTSMALSQSVIMVTFECI
jgi:peroxin-14